jgi:hypothetical protein
VRTRQAGSVGNLLGLARTGVGERFEVMLWNHVTGTEELIWIKSDVALALDAWTLD